MRKPIDSPFVPGSDAIPQVWAGRTSELSDWSDILRPRRLSGQYERGRTILGEAGLGKSALINRITRRATEAGDWVTPQLRIPDGTDPMKKLASALLDLADQAGLSKRADKRIGELMQRVQHVAAAGISVSLREAPGGQEAYSVLTELIVEIGEAAIDRNVMVMIHLDEVQNITDSATLSQILTALGDALAHEVTVTTPDRRQIRRFLPIAVYLSGLPEFEDLATARQGATFARRFQTTILRPVTEDELNHALQMFVTEGWPVAEDNGRTGHVYMDPEAQRAITEICHGEPFLFQLAGSAAWYADTTDVITRSDVFTGWRSAEPEAESHVERILDRLPAREREFIEAMAAMEPEDRTATKIAAACGFPAASNTGTFTRRLDRVRGILSRGKPYTFRHRAIEAFLTSEWPYMDDTER